MVRCIEGMIVRRSYADSAMNPFRSTHDLQSVLFGVCCSPMIDRAAFPVRFPIDNKYLSFDSRGFAKVRRGSIYLHAGTPSLTNSIVNVPSSP